MDLRPQGPEIIRTWLFDTLVRSTFEHGGLPWAHATINGWILDPDRKKMSKSKGNVVTPMTVLSEHGSDAVRYWACSGRPGTDTALDVNQFKVGRRLAIKILNASKFVLNLGAPAQGAAATEALDRAMLEELAGLAAAATSAFEGFDYARALERSEAFFWSFCDDYVELVKGRAYGAQGESAPDSARAALRVALSVLLRLFAPVLPFVTEEVWSWWQEGSVHRGGWPIADEIRAALHAGGPPADPIHMNVAASVLAPVRRAKSEAKRSMRAPVELVRVSTSPQRAEALEAVRSDLLEAGTIGRLVIEAVADRSDDVVEVVLAPDQPAA